MPEYAFGPATFEGVSDLDLVALAHAVKGSPDESDKAFRKAAIVEMGRRMKPMELTSA